MRGKMSVNELESANNLMTMSVYFIIADSFEIDAMDLQAYHDLQKDLGMTAKQKQQLIESAMDLFEGQKLDFSMIHKVQDVVDQLVTYRDFQTLH